MKRLSSLTVMLMLSFFAMANSVLTFDLDNEERRLFEFELNQTTLTVQLEGLTLNETYGVVIGNRQGATCNNLVSAHQNQTLIASTATMGGFEATATALTLTISQEELCNQQLYFSIYRKYQAATPGVLPENSPLGTNPMGADAEIIYEQLFNSNPNYAVTNAYLEGTPESFGTFYNGMTSISMDDGLMLATGAVWVAMGPNTETDATFLPNTGHYDSDLSNLVGQPSFDASALHFDVVTNNSILELEYVFASEEYCDWVGSQFDDAFGIFISGPGISGSFNNGAELMSSIYNTGQPISINNVNYFDYPELYVSNVPPWQQQYSGGCSGDEIGAIPYAPDDIQYDGFTVPMLAEIQVVPGETYHVKVVIADMGDPIYDAGVFLQASPNVPVVTTYAVDYIPANGATHIIRNCEASVGSFEISRPASELGTVVTVDVDYSGMGANHLDMNQMPSTITFDANELTKTIDIVFLPGNPQTGDAQLLITINNAVLPQAGVSIKDLISNIEITNPQCFNIADGTIEITTIVGVNPYTYTLDGNPLSSNIVEGLSGGTYTLQTTDALGCTGTQTIEILAPSAIVIESSDVIDNTCLGANNGSISLNVSGGTGDLTVVWSNGEEGTMITDLEPGIYNATIMDTLGCSISEDFEIEVGEDPTVFNQSISHVTCNGLANGAIAFEVMGGLAPYEYLWENGTIGDSIRMDLTAGTYFVNVIDANSCVNLDTFEIEEPDVLEIEQIDFVQNPCYPTDAGTFTLNAVGGTAPYTYYLDGNEVAPTMDNLGTGTVQIQVIDANDCEATLDLALFEELTFDVTVTASAPGFCEGSAVELTAMMDNADSFIWNGGMATKDNTFTVTEAGTITVVGINTDGCQGATSIDIVEHESPITGIPTGEVEPELNNTYIYEVALSLPNSTLEWVINGGTILSYPTPNTVEILWEELGSQSIEVTEASSNGCFGPASSLEVEVGMDGFVSYNVQYQETNDISYVIRHCEETTGSLSFGRSIEGLGTETILTITYEGTGVEELDMELMPATITFGENELTTEIPIHFVDNNTMTDITFVSVGLAEVDIAPALFSIKEMFAFIDTTLPSCYDSPDASIELNVPFGKAPFTHALNGLNFSTDIINNLPAGTYDLMSQDALGCSVSQTFTIEAPEAIALDNSEVVQLTCESTNDASIFVAASGGVGDLNYTWLNGMQGNQIDNLSAGTYIAQVIDDNGCVYIDEFVITEVQNPTIAEELLNNVACNSEATGNISIDVIGTNAPFEYTWSDGAMATTERNELTAGTYQVEITDTNGCATTAEFVIAEPAALELVETNFEQSLCYPIGGGIFTFEGSGGVAPYVFYENGDEIATTVDNFGTGTSNIELIDANGCTVEAELTQYEALEFEVSVEASASGFCEGGNVILTANMDNYDGFIWNDAIFTPGNQFPVDMAGTVEIVGINLDGCEGTTSIEIIQYETPTTAVPTGAITVLLDEQHIYEVTNSLTNSTIEWNVTGGTILSNPTPNSVEVLWNTLGLQTLTATEISENDCTGNLENLEVQVDMLDNVNEITQNQGIQLYPNPFDNQTQLILDMPTLSAVQVDLYNINGQLLQTHQMTPQSSLAIQRAGLPSGTYVLVVSGESFRFHERVVVR